jgi:hypothetical protein
MVRKKFIRTGIFQSLLFSILAGLIISGNAQLSKGDKFIGGTAYIFGAAQRETKELIFPTPGMIVLNVNPLLGFVLNEKYALGAQAGILVGLERNRGSDDMFGFGAGLMGRRFFTLSDRCLWTIHGQFNYQYILQDASSSRPRPSDFHEWQIALRPAVIYFPTPAWGFEAGIGSVGLAWANNRTEKTRDFQVFAGLGQFKLGINYYIRK